MCRDCIEAVETIDQLCTRLAQPRPRRRASSAFLRPSSALTSSSSDSAIVRRVCSQSVPMQRHQASPAAPNAPPPARTASSPGERQQATHRFTRRKLLHHLLHIVLVDDLEASAAAPPPALRGYLLHLCDLLLQCRNLRRWPHVTRHHPVRQHTICSTAPLGLGLGLGLCLLQLPLQPGDLGFESLHLEASARRPSGARHLAAQVIVLLPELLQLRPVRGRLRGAANWLRGANRLHHTHAAFADAS